MRSDRINLVGQRFGRLLVIGDAPSDKGGKARFLVKCDCGKEKVVRGESLRNGSITSCGCYRLEQTKRANSKFGGCRKERLYGVWDGMKQRCYNKNNKSYHRYGGRGITVCDEWLNSYGVFREFMLSNGYDVNAPQGIFTLDRIDNDGNYCPENCRVVSFYEQSRNKVTNHLVSNNGERTNITDVAKSLDKNLNLSRGNIYFRLAHLLIY